MKTFCDLNKFLHYFPGNIVKWLGKKWKGKNKQESLLRLFASLGCISKLNDWDICKGNYNIKTIEKQTSLNDLFYDNGIKINLKDKGDSSDLTAIHKRNDKHILVTTSKDLNKMNIGKMDIDKILTNFKQYEKDGYTMSLCICIRDNNEFQIMKKRIEKTNKELLRFINKEDTIYIDWNDLEQAYHQFKLIYKNKTIDEIIHLNKNPLCLKMHQKLGVLKTLKMKKENKRKILWGHIQRSGKSYIIGGCIIEDSYDKNVCNYIVITTAPNETIDQYKKVFDCLQLQDFNIIVLNGENKEPLILKKNIILCSKQFLQSKLEETTNIKWLKKMKFDMRFIDESHNGGTTTLAQETLNYYGNKTFTIQITATYSKPINDYDISKDCWVLWDLEDIKLCKNIDNKNNIKRLVEKHGNEFQKIINEYSEANIISEYSKYPELHLLTDKIDSKIIKDIIKNTKDNHYGWSSEACFLLKQNNEKKMNEFQNEKENLKLWYKIFGKKGNYGIPYNSYPDDIVFMKRIEKICHDPETNSRYIGECVFLNEPMVILAFLPQNNIFETSFATKQLLEKYNIIPEYDIIAINSKITMNPKKKIDDARIIAKNSGKKGILVLSGRQCSLGVSIDYCDIVLLLNNNMGYDMIYQMMFRCMTEGKNKKCGFVVDLNLNRVVETSIVKYSSLIKPKSHLKEAVKYILQAKLLVLNGDHWLPSFGNNITELNNITDNVYELYLSNIEKVLNNYLNKLSLNKVLLTSDEIKIMKDLIIKTSKNQKKYSIKDETINKGIEKIKIEKINIDRNNIIKNNEEKKINYMEIVKDVVPLICLLTIREKNTSLIEMFDIIQNDEKLYNILISQMQIWWSNKNINKSLIYNFINIYKKYMIDNLDAADTIRNIKELFIKNIRNSKKLSKIIDKYFIPKENEKKKNAEVTTPFKLRQEILDKIPSEFWKSEKKILEPCSGKGGFVIDIIDKFMIGLKEIIPNEKDRYKTIVEKCLYFCDINPANIFINKLLIDPQNEYKINYYEGNTLDMNINEETNTWKSVTKFDAVIGNPPYTTSQEDNSRVSKPLYHLFVEKFIDITDKLLFVIPSRWFVTGKGLGKFRKCIQQRKDIESIQHTDSSKKWFGPIVDIKGGCCILYKNSNYNGFCKFNGVIYDLNLTDKILNPKYFEIIKIFKKFENIQKIFVGRCFGIETNDKRIIDDKNNNIVCYVSVKQNKDRKRYINLKVNNEMKFWKVISPTAVKGAYSGFDKLFILNEDEVHSGSYVSFKVETEFQANSLKSYLQTKIVNKLLSIRKVSQTISKDTCKYIPLVPFDRNWTDEKIYEYLKLSQEQINIL